MSIRVLSALCALAFAAVPMLGLQARQTDTASVRAAIASVLDESARGWNAGDLDLFMVCYERGPGTTYVSGGRLIVGFDAIRATYESRFASGRRTMGDLSLTVLDVHVIGRDHAYVVGRFRLHRAGTAPDAEGVTTLLFRRSGVTWRIVADHS